MNSPLVTRDWPADSSNYSVGRGGNKIIGIVIHHAASTSLDSVGTVFARAGRGGSAHYGVGGDQIHQYVDENDTAWHCSNWWGNQHCIGIETINSAAGGDWPVSEQTFETLVKLVADIAKRHSLGVLVWAPDGDGTGITKHNDWQGAATVCCGPYLSGRLNELCERANAINFPPVATETKPEINWQALDKPISLRAGENAFIIRLDDMSHVGGISAGTIVSNVVDYTDYNGARYYRTQWSHDRGINNALEATKLLPIEEVTEGPIEVDIPADKITATHLPGVTDDNIFQPVYKPELSVEDEGYDEAVDRAEGAEFTSETSHGHGLGKEQYEQLVADSKKIKEEAMETQEEIVEQYTPKVSSKTKLVVYFVGDGLLGLGALYPQIASAIYAPDPVAQTSAIAGAMMTAGLFLLTMFGIYKSGKGK